MSIRNKPNYGLFAINLSNAGSLDLPVVGTRIALVTAVSGAVFSQVAGATILAGGTVAPSTIVNVQIGKALGDPIPFGVNTKVNVDDAFEFVRLSWASQNGVTAFFLIDDDRAGAGIFIDAPAAILGGSVALQQGGNTAIVTAGNGSSGAALQVDPTKSPTPLGASFATLLISAAGVTTILSPASNTKGCWLRTAELSPNGNTITVQLYADTAAPTGVDDTTKRRVFGVVGPATQLLPAPLLLPAGIGLYVAESGGSSSRVAITWDLIT